LTATDPVRARQRREDAESERLLDSLDAMRADSRRATVQELSAWLGD
jgi:hypothetical protein